MERKWRSCPNRKCPSKRDKDGGFTKVGFKTDSKKDPYFCPQCRKKLPAYVPVIDPDINTDPSDPDDITNPPIPSNDTPKKIFNLKGWFSTMTNKNIFKNWVLPILGAIVFLFLAMFAITIVSWYIPQIVAYIICIAMFIFFFWMILRLIANNPKWNEKTSITAKVAAFTGLTVLIVAFIVWGFLAMLSFAPHTTSGTNSTVAATTTSTVVTNDSEVETTTSTAVNNSAAIPAVNPGLDQPSKSWFLAKAGTLISGDIAIFDNDNNSKKIPVYDSKEGTADIIYLNQDTYIWAEWGCYTIDNANTQDIATLINNKLDANFTSVRYFNGYNKLGTNTPAIISSHIDASSIALPSLTTKK